MDCIGREGSYRGRESGKRNPPEGDVNTDFIPVTLDLADDYLAYFHATPRRSADYTLTNLWGWAEYYGLELSLRTDLCWIRQTRPFTQLWAPVGNWEHADWDAHSEIRMGSTLHRVPIELGTFLSTRLGNARSTTEPTREQWEYLYDRAELAMLPGNRFHKKKNLVNQYRKLYGMEYRPLHIGENAAMLRDALQLQEEWFRRHDDGSDPSLLAENNAIFRVLHNWSRLPGLMGGSLYVENTMTAFTIGEPLDASTLVLHFEKARHGYKGAYQAINNAFAQHIPEIYTTLNREQDLGEEGMRQAKETYNPTGFLHKEKVIIQAAQQDWKGQNQRSYLYAS